MCLNLRLLSMSLFGLSVGCSIIVSTFGCVDSVHFHQQNNYRWIHQEFEMSKCKVVNIECITIER